MRVLVVGGGAIGGITAALMTADVVVLDANEEHVAALRDPGLIINDEAPVAVHAVSSIDELEGEFDVALVAVKSPLHSVALPPLVQRGGIGAFCSMASTSRFPCSTSTGANPSTVNVGTHDLLSRHVVAGARRGGDHTMQRCVRL